MHSGAIDFSIAVPTTDRPAALGAVWKRSRVLD